MRFGKRESLRIALSCVFIYDRTTRIPPLQHLGAFVDSLASSIIDGLTEHLHIIVRIHLHNLGVSTRNKKADERERRSRLVVITFLDEMRHHVSLQVIDINQRNVERAGESLGKADTYEQ